MKTKSFYTIIVALMVLMSLSFMSISLAQSPDKMTYQSVIRNTTGNLIANQAVGIKISILQGGPAGTVVFAETFTLSTNANGLVSLEIGTGTLISGSIAAIDWSSGPYFLKTEVDPAGGTTYTISSVTQFLSVPYALYSAKAGSAAGTAGGDLNGTYPNPTVVGIQSKPVSVAPPAVDQVLIWDGVNWTPGANVTGSASGDLSGTYPGPTVVKLQTLPVSAAAPATNDALVWNGAAWAPMANVSGAAGGDLLGSYPNPDVVGIRTRPVSVTAPNVNDVYQWNGAQWAPVASVSLGSNYWTLNGTNQIYNNNSGGLVGIGTNAPTYKLDVLHGGSTGAHIASSSGFSVVDIDAFSGDAALRFQKAGAGQWNIRNRPADNYLEIFELGGGGSRFVIQDATGWVGIGATASAAPGYQLDVTHGGSTGIRSKSDASFSVVDIDAFSGDAALRFQKAGATQWNIRNRPADDYLEIFEMGGGGSRMVIQDATGNVGIGATVAPAYKLDVEHGGSTGIRSKSTGSFSVVDIDGASGDAALRFQKAGVNQWNTRNNPATDDYQIFELGGGGERMRIDNTTGKVWVNGDFTVVGVKAFTMDHPLDPANKMLMHAAAESNEVINFYSGNVITDASGKATVQLPDYFEAINKDFRYQLTVIGVFAQAIVSKEVSNNAFEISTSQPNVKVSWEVKGVRHDAHMRKNPFVAEQEKSAAQKGKYIDPAAYNLSESDRVGYDATASGVSSLDYVAPVQEKKDVAATGGSLDPVVIPAAKSAPANSGGSLDPVVAPKSKTGPVDRSGSVSDVAPSAQPKAPAEPVEKGNSDK